MPVSIPNTLKELFKANEVALGMNVRLAARASHNDGSFGDNSPWRRRPRPFPS